MVSQQGASTPATNGFAASFPAPNAARQGPVGSPPRTPRIDILTNEATRLLTTPLDLPLDRPLTAQNRNEHVRPQDTTPSLSLLRFREIVTGIYGRRLSIDQMDVLASQSSKAFNDCYREIGASGTFSSSRAASAAQSMHRWNPTDWMIYHFFDLVQDRVNDANVSDSDAHQYICQQYSLSEGSEFGGSVLELAHEAALTKHSFIPYRRIAAASSDDGDPLHLVAAHRGRLPLSHNELRITAAQQIGVSLPPNEAEMRRRQQIDEQMRFRDAANESERASVPQPRAPACRGPNAGPARLARLGCTYASNADSNDHVPTTTQQDQVTRRSGSSCTPSVYGVFSAGVSEKEKFSIASISSKRLRRGRSPTRRRSSRSKSPSPRRGSKSPRRRCSSASPSRSSQSPTRRRTVGSISDTGTQAGLGVGLFANSNSSDRERFEGRFNETDLDDMEAERLKILEDEDQDAMDTDDEDDLEDDLANDNANDDDTDLTDRVDEMMRKHPWPTMKEMYDIDIQVCAPSVEKHIKCMQRRYIRYCVLHSIEQPFKPVTGLTLMLPADYKDDSLLEVVANLDLITSILQETALIPGMSTRNLCKMKKFLQSHLHCEKAAREKYRRHSGQRVLIRDISKVIHDDRRWKATLRDHKKAVAQKELDDCVDLQSYKMRPVTNRQKVALLLSAYFTDHPAVAGMDNLYRLQTSAQMCLADKTGRRGEHFRALTLSNNYVEPYLIGPSSDLLTSFWVVNFGKSVTSRKLREESGSIAHVNPLQDASGWTGQVYLLCFGMKAHLPQCIGQELPNFSDYHTYSKLPVFRSVRDHKKGVGDTQYSRNWLKFLIGVGIDYRHTTHIFRVNAHNEMLRNNLPHHTITLTLGYGMEDDATNAQRRSNENQNKHYFTMIPPNALVERAGGDPTNTKGHEPVWFTTINKLMPHLEQLIEFSFPGLLPNAAVQIQRFKIADNHKERIKNRLYMNKGAAEGFVFQIMVMILQMAARPINPDNGLLLTDQPPIFLILRKSTILHIAWHQMFDQAAFLHILGAMTDAQGHEYKLRTSFQLPPKQMDLLNQTLNPFFTSMQQTLVTLQSQVQQLSKGNDFSGHSPNKESADKWFKDGNFQKSRRQLAFAIMNRHEDLENDITKKGTKRMKSRPITVADQNMVRMLLNEPQVVPFRTGEEESIHDYWYYFTMGSKDGSIPPLIDLETQGKTWRKDIDNKNTLRMAWSKQKNIFQLPLFYMYQRKLTEAQALQEAEKTFASVPKSKNGRKPLVKDLAREFAKQLMFEEHHKKRVIDLENSDRFDPTSDCPECERNLNGKGRKVPDMSYLLELRKKELEKEYSDTLSDTLSDAMSVDDMEGDDNSFLNAFRDI